MSTPENTVVEYRQRAAELRILADKMRDKNRREMVRNIAASYDRIADQFEDLNEKRETRSEKIGARSEK